MTHISKYFAFACIPLLTLHAHNQENLSATKEFVKHLVSLEQMQLTKQGDTNRYTPTSKRNDQDYTETTYANGKTEIVQPLSAHHFDEDAYTKCSRYAGGPYTMERYYCTANMPTEELAELKREADAQRLAKVVDRMSPQTLTVLKHAFATGEYKLQRRHDDTDTSKSIAIDMQTTTLHPEVEKIRQHVLCDATNGKHQSAYERWRNIFTGHAAYFIRFDEYSFAPTGSDFSIAYANAKAKEYDKYANKNMSDSEIRRRYGHMKELWPDFSYQVNNLNIHEGNIDLFKKAVEAKVGKAEYPAKPAEEKQKDTVLGAMIYSAIHS